MAVGAVLAAPASGARGPSEVGRLEVSEAAGIGQIEVRGDLAAVVERDQGYVSLVDVSDARRPKLVGRYDGNTGQQRVDDPFDGDVVFSHDGAFLFYARQTHQFSLDGLHVLDISDPSAPRRTFYEAQGGMFRVGYYHRDDAEYVYTLDATHGLVAHRFVRPAGIVVPTWADPLPALKVGGPASAGIFIDAKDASTKAPLMYVTTGRGGLDIYDLSTPETPEKVGALTGMGLADVAVVDTPRSRTVYAATEYWFLDGTKPEIVVLDATDLSAIEETDRISAGAAADDASRVQGIEVVGGSIYAAHSQLGLVVFGRNGNVESKVVVGGKPNESHEAPAAPYAMDVEVVGKLIYLTDAATGTLTILQR